MPSSAQERLLRWLGRTYGLMLLAYPPAFRRDYSREMTLLFRNRARDVVEKAGSVALVPFMRHVLADWVSALVRERIEVGIRGKAVVTLVTALSIVILGAWWSLDASKRRSMLEAGAHPMVQITVVGNTASFEVEGWDRMWSLKSRLDIPLAHIRGVRADPAVVRGWWHGVKAPGTNLPGVVTAGTFYQHGKRVFWDVHDAERTIVIELSDERYDELIIEVSNPTDSIRLLQSQQQHVS